MTSTPRVADLLAQHLARHTRFAFGVPGGEVLTFVDALDQAGVRFVLCRHEASAGFAAEAAQRVGGGIGLLVATLGPGAANTVLPALNAAQARRPLVIVTGCIAAHDEGTYTHQIVDHRRLLEPVVKASFRVSAKNAAAIVERALTLAMEGTPGPVHLDLPTDVADTRLDALGREGRPLASVATTTIAATTDQRPARASARSSARIQRSLRNELRGARRVVVLAGLEMLDADEPSPLRGIAASGVPVLTTYEAKGLVDEHHEASLGAFGLSPRADATILPWLREADFVVLAGYDPIEVRTSWREPFGPDASVVELTRREGGHGMYHATHRLVGDPTVTLASLFDEVPPTRRWLDEARPLRTALDESFAAREPFEPSAIVRVLEETIPDDAWWTVDTGAHRIVLSQVLRMRRPRLIQSSGLSTMACALPFAIGAKLASPSTPVVAVLGDGGFEMAMGELVTARELGLALTIVLLDDRSLALIEAKQRQRGLPNVGVDYVDPGPDHAALARACGARGLTASTPDELRAAVHVALASDRPTLIHVRLPRGSYDDRM